MTESNVSTAERMTITKVFKAPPELVWKAWTDPESISQWWGPDGFSTPVYQMDFRVGGKYLYCMKSPDGQEFWGAGEYFEIVPNKKIVSSMFFADSSGNRVEPEHLGIEHKAIDDEPNVILFEDIGNGETRLTFIGNESMQDAIESGQVEGMNQILEKLVKLLATMAAS